jgi:flagellar assembly factor FliW
MNDVDVNEVVVTLVVRDPIAIVAAYEMDIRESGKAG